MIFLNKFDNGEETRFNLSSFENDVHLTNNVLMRYNKQQKKMIELAEKLVKKMIKKQTILFQHSCR